ncbi:MAG: hypothetical protein [Geminiviridae sp.]|nr:MAG: hypothetical protein [Geminiviridae sp.]
MCLTAVFLRFTFQFHFSVFSFQFYCVHFNLIYSLLAVDIPEHDNAEVSTSSRSSTGGGGRETTGAYRTSSALGPLRSAYCDIVQFGRCPHFN